VVSCLSAYQEANMIDPENLTVWLEWSYVYYEQGDYEQALGLVIDGMDEMPDEANLYYYATAYLICDGKFREAFNFLENALTLDFDKHEVLYEFFPQLETQKALFKIIDQYRK